MQRNMNPLSIRKTNKHIIAQSLIVATSVLDSSLLIVYKMSDYRGVGLLGCQTIGMSDYWGVGLSGLPHFILDSTNYSHSLECGKVQNTLSADVSPLLKITRCSLYEI